MAKKSKCRISVEDSAGSIEKDFSFSEVGFHGAIALAKQESNNRRRSSYRVVIACVDSHAMLNAPNHEAPDMVLVSCDQGKCRVPTSWDNEDKTVLASGAVDKPKKAKKPRKKVPKSQQTPAQLKFADAAADCKGTGNYRSCMSKRLSKK